MSELATTTNTTTATGGDLVGTTADRGVYRPGEASDFTPQERERLRALGGLDEASDADLAMLFEVAKRSGLDPFIREIYLVGRKTKTGGYRGEPERWETKWTVQTGIDGFRKVFFRWANSLGIGHRFETVFFDENGQEFKVWLNPHRPPAAVIVRAIAGDHQGEGFAPWHEFVQTTKAGEPNSMWRKMGSTMLAKCAKAQAIRDVCDLTAGLYVDEEMGQADSGNRVQAHAERLDVAPSGRGAAGVREALAQHGHPVPDSQPVAEVEAAPADDAVAEVDPEFMADVRAALNGFTTATEVKRYVEQVKAAHPGNPDADPEFAALHKVALERYYELETEGAQ